MDIKKGGNIVSIQNVKTLQFLHALPQVANVKYFTKFAINVIFYIQ